MQIKTQAVKLIPVQAGPSPWKVSHGGQTGDTPANYPTVKLDRDAGPHFITFELSGNHSGVTFSAKDPIWVQEGGKPTQFAEHPQIGDAKVKDQGKKLVVFDWNDNEQPITLHYQLNFDGHAALDPAILNGGGGGSQPAPSLDYGLLIGVAAVAFILGFLTHLGVRALRRR